MVDQFESRARDYSQFSDPLGLVLDDSTQLEAFDIAAIIETASAIKSSVSWVMGDITNYARKNHNDSWIDFLSHKVELRTLNNYASVAGKISRERRRINLSFSHHSAVAALPEDEQDYWLDRAEKEELTRDELRQMVKDVSKVEKRTVVANVGSIDKLLTLDLGLPLGFEVKIVYVVVSEADTEMEQAA